MTDEVIINRRIHQQYIVILFISRLNEGILLIRIVGVQINYLSVLIGLYGLYFFAVLIQRKVLLFSIGKQYKIFGFFVKLIFANNAVFYKQTNIAPFLLHKGTVKLK